MNKKAAERIVFGTLIGLIIGAIIFVTVLIPLFRIIYNYVGSGIEESSSNNFDELDRQLNELLKDEKLNEITMPFYLEKDFYILVGFDSRCTPKEGDINCPISTCHSSDSDYHIPLPGSCFVGKSCLCLFEETTILGDFDGEDNKPKRCYSYPKADHIVSSINDVNVGLADSVGGRGVEYLVVYGECSNALGPAKLNIKKIKLNDKETLIEMTPIVKQ